MFRQRAGLPVHTYVSNDFDQQGNHLNHGDVTDMVSLSGRYDAQNKLSSSAAE